ncbi:MAG: hypothetical protein CSA86_04295 [Arcobacter sp.]|nr:MAG: hypothetical protein CSA86_04295 [Arcobacter sp.]
MAYRYDEDLEFLSEIKSENLEDLVYLLTHDKDGSKRVIEELTSSVGYKRYYPEHNKYWEYIAEELQKYGANTFATIIRGRKGVLYKEILIDVCEKLKVNFNKNSSTETIENNMLMKILENTLEKMSEEELKELAKELKIKDFNQLNKQALTALFITIFKAGGFKSYQLSVVIANAILKALIGRGLSFGANATLTRTLAILTGPIGWIITGIWTALDIAGPAFRVTMPAVLEIAILRQMNNNEKIS